MAEQLTFTKQDLEYYYSIVDPGKNIDIDRLTSELGPGPWTLEQLQNDANLNGLSARSKSAWSDVLSEMNSDVGSYTGAPSEPSGPSGPGPITMPPNYQYPSGFQEALGGGQATGYSWNPYKNQGQGGWDLVQGNPQITYWQPTNEYFYQGVPINPEQLNSLLTQGPYTTTGVPPGLVSPGTGGPGPSVLGPYMTPVGPTEAGMYDLWRQGPTAFMPPQTPLTPMLERNLQNIYSYLPQAGLSELTLADLMRAGPEGTILPSGRYEDYAGQVLGMGPEALRPAESYAQQALNEMIGRGMGAFTPPPSWGEEFAQSYLAQGPQGMMYGGGPLTPNLERLLLGGPQSVTPGAGLFEQRAADATSGGWQGLAAPATQGESALYNFMNDPYLASLAAGQVPDATMQQYLDQQARAQAGITESLGTMGARFGSDVQDLQAQAWGEALNTLMANSEQQALAAQGLRGSLAQQGGGLEAQRYQDAQQIYTSLVSAGMSAENARLLSGLENWTQLYGLGVQDETQRARDALQAWNDLFGATIGAGTSRNITGAQQFGGALGTGAGIGAQTGAEALNAWQNILGQTMGTEAARRGQGLQTWSQFPGQAVQAEINRQGLGSNAYLNALGQYMGSETDRARMGSQLWGTIGTGLVGSEQGRSNLAMDMLFRDYLLNSGVPPEIAGLPQTSTGGTQTTSGGGGNWFGAAASGGALLGSLLLAPFTGGMSLAATPALAGSTIQNLPGTQSVMNY